MTPNQQALLDRMNDPLFTSTVPENIEIARAAFPLAVDGFFSISRSGNAVAAVAHQGGRLVVMWFDEKTSGYEFKQHAVTQPVPSLWVRFCRAVVARWKAVLS